MITKCHICKLNEAKWIVRYNGCNEKYLYKETKRCSECMSIAKRNKDLGIDLTIEPFYED